MSKQLLAAAITLSLVGTASAQFGFGSGTQRIQRPFDRPTVSPYINLLRNGGAGLNYYGIVRPDQQFGSSINQLQMGLGGQRVGARGTPLFAGGRLRSGHVVVFDSYRNISGGSGFGGGGFGGGGFGGGGFGGGGGFSPGFMSRGGGGGFGGGGIGGGNNSSFSPISGGALNSAQSGGNIGGGAVIAGGGGGGQVGGSGVGGGGGGIQGGTGMGQGTPWGSGMSLGGAGNIGRTGHVVIFDLYRQTGPGN